MNSKRGTNVTGRRVWHIGPDAPQGRYVDAPADAAPPPADAADTAGLGFPGWALSSYELRAGLDVFELFSNGEPSPPAHRAR